MVSNACYTITDEFNYFLPILEQRIPQLKREYSKGLVKEYSNKTCKSIKFLKKKQYSNIKYFFNKKTFYIPITIFSEICFSLNYNKVYYFEISNIVKLDLINAPIEEFEKQVIIHANRIYNEQHIYQHEIRNIILDNELNTVFNNINKIMFEFNLYLENKFNISNFL